MGIGAVKYADLSTGHDTEYVFDFDRMLALTGNTGPYVQYAAARIRSILRKAGALDQHLKGAGAAAAPVAAIAVVEPAERALVLHLLEYDATLRKVGEALEPHRLCAYLFELAQLFTSFYDQCPVLKADDTVRESRLALCGLVLRRLSHGLDLLGIETPENM